MAVAFDTLAAAEAMESAGVEPRQARTIAGQMQVAASAGKPVTRPALEATLAGLKMELLDRIGNSERRTAAMLWRLFGGIVAVAGVAVAALKYLP